MASIHFVERLNKVTKVQGTNDEWESGNWVVSQKTAQSLVGGDLYLHSDQNEASHFGGEIIGFRVHRGSHLNDRVVFRIRASPKYRGVRTEREGWGNEKKIVP